MNNLIKSGEVFKLSELLPYKAGEIADMEVASNDGMRFFLKAFDEGTSLAAHKAPGDAIVIALEGRAIINYEGEDYHIKPGETFRFDKGGLHSVTADGKFKMALVIALK